jgi:hypothetical protein
VYSQAGWIAPISIGGIAAALLYAARRRCRHALVRGASTLDLFANDDGTKLLNEIKSAFERGPVFERSKKSILFVCGGPVELEAGKEPSLRREFLNWARENLKDFVLILAEHAFKQTRLYRNSAFINVAKFESLIASIADFILIFPESAGSYSEVGYFSRGAAIRTKILVGNDSLHEGRPSFLINGPLKLIDDFSTLRPRILIDTRNPLDAFALIRDRLEEQRVGSERTKFEYAAFGKLAYRDRFLAVLEMIRILRLVSLRDLRYALKHVFNRASGSAVQTIVSILLGGGYVSERDGLFYLGAGRTSLLEFKNADLVTELMARAMSHYSVHRPDISEAVKGLEVAS